MSSELTVLDRELNVILTDDELTTLIGSEAKDAILESYISQFTHRLNLQVLKSDRNHFMAVLYGENTKTFFINSKGQDILTTINETITDFSRLHNSNWGNGTWIFAQGINSGLGEYSAVVNLENPDLKYIIYLPDNQFAGELPDGGLVVTYTTEQGLLIAAKLILDKQTGQFLLLATYQIDDGLYTPIMTTGN